MELVKKEPSGSQSYTAPTYHLADANGETGSALPRETSHSEPSTDPSLHHADGKNCGSVNDVLAAPEEASCEDGTISSN